MVFSKDNLRKRLLKERSALAAEQVADLSEKIQTAVLQSPFWPASGKIGIYAAMRNEVLTHELFRFGLENGFHVYFPRVEQGLSFYEVHGPEFLHPGAWAIPEPDQECEVLDETSKLDLLIIPGLVFNNQGYRIGYGRAFYDRVVGLVARCSIGLAYDFQVVDQEWTIDSWDKPLDGIVTEIRTIIPRLEKIS